MRRLPHSLVRCCKALLSRSAFAAAGFLAATALFGLDRFEGPSQAFLNGDEPPSTSAHSKAGLAPFDDAPSKVFAAAPAHGSHGAPERQWIVPFWIDPTSAPLARSRAIAIASQAAKSWEPCGARFEYQGPKTLKEYGPYGPSETPELAATLSWMALPDDDSGLAFTDAAPASSASPQGEPQVTQWAIQLDPGSTDTPGSLLATATHEFGHVLGLAHSRDKSSIMFGGENSALRPTPRDIEECRNVLAAWTEQDAALHSMATLAPEEPPHSSVSTAPTLRSKSIGGTLQGGMNTQASK